MGEPVETVLAAITAGWATPQEVADAVAARRAQRPLIGQLLLKHRKLTVHVGVRSARGRSDQQQAVWTDRG